MPFPLPCPYSVLNAVAMLACYDALSLHHMLLIFTKSTDQKRGGKSHKIQLLKLCVRSKSLPASMNEEEEESLRFGGEGEDKSRCVYMS